MVGTPTTGIAQVAGSVGKPGRTQHLGNLFKTGARSAITGGDPLVHGLMNHYGKNPPSSLGGMAMPGSTSVDPTQHPGVKQIRGGSGGIKRNPRTGALGPGPMGAVGGDTNSVTNEDTE